MSKSTSKRAFISYLEDNGEERAGFFDILEITQSYIKFQTRGNILSIPWHRVKKMKEEKEE